MALNMSNHVKFKLCKPIGYYPPDVDKAIDEYEVSLTKVNQKLMEALQENNRLKARNAKLEEELRALHIEMSSIELPDPDETAGAVVLQEFRGWHAPDIQMGGSEMMPQPELLQPDDGELQEGDSAFDIPALVNAHMGEPEQLAEEVDDELHGMLNQHVDECAEQPQRKRLTLRGKKTDDHGADEPDDGEPNFTIVS